MAYKPWEVQENLWNLPKRPAGMLRTKADGSVEIK
jgi:hypothetical protein